MMPVVTSSSDTLPPTWSTCRYLTPGELRVERRPHLVGDRRRALAGVLGIADPHQDDLAARPAGGLGHRRLADVERAQRRAVLADVAVLGELGEDQRAAEEVDAVVQPADRQDDDGEHDAEDRHRKPELERLEEVEARDLGDQPEAHASSPQIASVFGRRRSNHMAISSRDSEIAVNIEQIRPSASVMPKPRTGPEPIK